MTTKTGDRYTFSRRDLVHGSLTFHVEVTGTLPNGTVLATQCAIEYPDGSTRPSKPVHLEISRADFRHYSPTGSTP